MLPAPSKLPDSRPDHSMAGSQPRAQGGESRPTRAAISWWNLRRPNGSHAFRGEGRNAHFVYGSATIAATALFLLMYSGPPRFRIRDPVASLRGDIDWVVMLNIVVWGLAGAWVLVQVEKRGGAKRLLTKLWLPQKLGLIMIFFLMLSAIVSKAPALSMFKIYEMAVSLLFTQLFAERFGYTSGLRCIFWGTAFLCGAIAVCAFLDPHMVWIASDFNPDPSRLRGDLIAPTGTVSAFAIILLLTGVRRLWRLVPLALFALFTGLLVFSLMRTAYVVVLAFFALVLIKRPRAKSLRQFVYIAGAAAAMLYAYRLVPSLSQYRDPEDIASLGDRLGLWRYLTHVTLTQSPWLGLGYYSASRVYGPQYNPGLGTAHSMFFEVLLGGGLVSFALFVALCAVLSAEAIYLLCKNNDRFSFAIVLLFFAAVIFGSMGDDLDSGPMALCFWYSAAVLPWLYQRSLGRSVCANESGKRLPAVAGALPES